MTPFKRWMWVIALGMVWSSSFIFMKKGLIFLRSDHLAAIRIAVASLALLPLLIGNIKHVKREKIKYLFVLGLFGSFIPAFLFTKAQTVVNSGTAGILNSLSPFFTLIIGVMFFKMKATVYKLAGVLVGLTGAISLIISRGSASHLGHFDGTMVAYALLIVIATIFYGTTNNIVKTYLMDMRPVLIAAVSFLCIGPIAIIYLVSTGFITDCMTRPGIMTGVMYGCILGIWNTALPVIFYNRLIQKSDQLFASFVTYFIPIGALFWGFLDGEHLGLASVLSLSVILVGVYISNLRNYGMNR